MRLGRKITGGKYKKARKKRFYEKAGATRYVKFAQEKRKVLRVRGGNKKVVLLAIDKANVYDPITKKSQLTKIKSIIETPSNRFLARKNIMTKGAIIETEKGKAKITNRPSQEGTINAILISK